MHSFLYLLQVGKNNILKQPEFNNIDKVKEIIKDTKGGLTKYYKANYEEFLKGNEKNRIISPMW